MPSGGTMAGMSAIAFSAAATGHRLRAAVLGMIIGLMVQFASGMLVNLFTTIPDGHPGSKPAEYFAGSFDSVRWAITQSGLPALVFHAGWGVLLIINSVVLLFWARRAGHRAVTISTLLGLLFVVGAAFNGASFLDFNEDYSSMIMASLSALAVLTYAVVLFLLPADT